MKTKNKITALLFLLAGITIPTVQSCKKYSDGPMISTHSRAERVTNSWRVENYKVNGNDYTSLVAGYTETFTKDGNYYFSFAGLSGTGVWTFQNLGKEIRITGIDHKESETLYILKLEEKQFWYYYLDGNDKNEFHMVEI